MDLAFPMVKEVTWAYLTNPNSVVQSCICAAFYFLTQLTKKSPMYTFILSVLRVWWITHHWASHVTDL